MRWSGFVRWISISWWQNHWFSVARQFNDEPEGDGVTVDSKNERQPNKQRLFFIQPRLPRFGKRSYVVASL